jgi:hypothetical protein
LVPLLPFIKSGTFFTMKYFTGTVSTLIFSLILHTNLFAQFDLNMKLVGHLDYQQDCNDIWAWVAPDGTEYAILGTVTGTAVISLEDHTAPREVLFIPGHNHYGGI